MKKKDVGTYFAALGVKSGELFDIAKVKIEIYSLKKEKEDILCNIGGKVYRMYLDKKFDEKRISEKCKSVAELDKEIKAKQEEIEKVHHNAGRMIKKALDGKEVNTKSHKDSKNVVEADSYEIVPIE